VAWQRYQGAGQQGPKPDKKQKNVTKAVEKPLNSYPPPVKK
jgi:hypothetical protein